MRHYSRMQRVASRPGATERSPTCPVRVGFVLLALAVLCAVQRAPAAAQGCVGDCNRDGFATVNELLKGVNIALGTLSLDQCSPFDMSGDGAVTVDEILVAVNNALSGCPSGEVTFDKISLAVMPGGDETLTVTATEDSGPWTVTSSAPSIVSVLKIGDKIKVTGVSLGKAAIMVTTQSRLRRSVPVRVYDPTVLDAGEILIKYIDNFECLVSPPQAAYGPASFYRPVVPGPQGWHHVESPSGTFVVPEGWQRLGTFGVPMDGCPDINGQQWMIVVKENPERADPITPPLVEPDLIGPYFPYLYSSVWGFPTTQFWRPNCPAGYVVMGDVESSSRPDYNPITGMNDYDDPEATCVREDLTAPGVEGDRLLSYGAVRTAAPQNSNSETTTAYLETGGFSSGDSPILKVLAVDLPPLIDVPSQTWAPHLNSDKVPPDSSEPTLTKVLLVPFTMVGDGAAYAAKGVGWMVENSPFIRVERRQVWRRVQWVYNSSSVVQTPMYKLISGMQNTDSTTISHEAGVSVTAEGGVEFLGTGGKLSATLSYKFGYSTNTQVSNFVNHEADIPLSVAPCTAAAVWQLASSMTVEMLNDQTQQLTEIAAMGTEDKPLYDNLNYVYDDYPIPDCP